jgi:cytochrome c553
MIKWTIGIVILGVVSFLFYRHSGFFLWSHQPLQYMPNMHRTPVLKPQRGYAFFEDFSAARTPPAGTLAREQDPYPFKGAQFTADQIPRSRNPLPITREVVLRGRAVYEANCIVCHGADGVGNGSVVPVYPNPPSLLADKLIGYADSQIYHVITNGQNIMGSYAGSIREQDRWAVVHYVRVLQLAGNPTDEDVKVFDQAIGKETQE